MAVTVGDPGDIGPEVTVKLLSTRANLQNADITDQWRGRARDLPLPTRVAYT